MKAAKAKVEPNPAEAEEERLRGIYKELAGEEADRRWSVDTLTQKIEALNASDDADAEAPAS